MPRHEEAKKDVASCEKPRVGAHNHISVDIRMGQPGPSNVGSPGVSRGRTMGSETSKYHQEEKTK